MIIDSLYLPLCHLLISPAGYQKFVDPAVSPEFQAAAMRFGITMAPPGVYMRYCYGNKRLAYRKIVLLPYLLWSCEWVRL